eukprot:CAMPEP_0176432794 /NCGR_PEP_ID=MMETSP0127-20121128/15599_1 /TAXON_ID=938130 /ORGANISM="Platyophrya macrostoma, Strain WH" /LENGTH=570 /DNA_ID=CAMNT_0017815019 /DNA_START=18 /DNA_END=1730 /DNA_ORIENTATION=-
MESLSTLDEKQTLELLKSLNQTEILEAFDKATPEERKGLVDQVNRLNGAYPGGLKGYYNQALGLLKNAKEDVNPYEGYIPDVPKGLKLDHYSPDIHEYEAIGLEEIKNTAFVLVAGGLGERLGYNGIKINIPAELITKAPYIQYYAEYILAYEKRSGATEIPLAIMTSDDTHELTVKVLKEHNNFGLKEGQITIVKQEKVPAMIDNEAHFALEAGKLRIDTKPHGHGDVHTLLYQYGLAKKWNEEGKKWIVFFQDTNLLVFRSVLPAIGVSKKNNYEVNSITVPRKPGEAVGALCSLSKEGEKNLTVNVEYNQIEALFKASGATEKTDAAGYSVFPGNINCLIFSIPEYNVVLNDTKGLIAEFINPKYADSTKTKFKSSTRLECMMQDYPKFLKSNDRVGVTQIDRVFSFSACKNDVKSAAAKFKSGLPAESASTSEYDLYRQNEELLKIVGVDVEQPAPEHKQDFEGIEINFGAKVVLKPSFGVTLKELKSRFQGTNRISSQSTAVFEGEIKVENLTLDGSVRVTKDVKDLTYDKKNYVTFDKLDGVPTEEYLKIRGFKEKGLENIETI